jgi:hypothetical protein
MAELQDEEPVWRRHLNQNHEFNLNVFETAELCDGEIEVNQL